MASVAGVWAVSYLVYASALMAVRLLHQSGGWMWAAPALVLLMALTLWRPGPSADPQVEVAAVQTQSMELAALVAHTKAAQQADVVVWPELSASATVHRGDTLALQEASREGALPPFITSYRDAATPMPHNVAGLFSKGSLVADYAKRKPFGAERKEHAPGKEAVTAEMDGRRLRLNICFDSCFPFIMRDRIAQDEPDLILLPTLDPIASYGTIQGIHAAYSPFRAAELGLPIVRADITAYSHVVDATGAIIAEAGSGTEEVITAKVGPPRRTIYRWAGDWFLVLCAILAAWGAVLGIREWRDERRERASAADDADKG